MKKILLFAAIVIVSVSVSLTMINHVQAQDSQSQEQLEVWTVGQGDTLWSIANENRGRTDVRKYIYQIQKLNDINSTIYPGQKIILPRTK